MLLKDVIGKELPGWQSLYGYFMERAHGCMGSFPVIKSETKQIVVCLNRKDLEKIWYKLPIHQVKVSKYLFHVNKAEKLAIIMGGIQGDDANSDDFFLIQDGEIEAYLKEEEFFEYASGLLSLVDESHATFPKE